MEGQARDWLKVRGKGTAACPVEQEPVQLHQHQNALLGRSCFSTVIPKSRTAVPAVELWVEEIDKHDGEELKSSCTRPTLACI